MWSPSARSGQRDGKCKGPEMGTEQQRSFESLQERVGGLGVSGGWAHLEVQLAPANPGLLPEGGGRRQGKQRPGEGWGR